MDAIGFNRLSQFALARKANVDDGSVAAETLPQDTVQLGQKLEPPQVGRLSAQFLGPAGMDVIEESRLPESAHHTLELISAGRRFSGRRNGIVFSNHEGLLPKKPEGYYTEWTVRERGQTGRKKDRIVAGQAGELFFTTNHYKSFRWVIKSTQHVTSP